MAAQETTEQLKTVQDESTAVRDALLAMTPSPEDGVESSHSLQMGGNPRSQDSFRTFHHSGEQRTNSEHFESTGPRPVLENSLGTMDRSSAWVQDHFLADKNAFRGMRRRPSSRTRLPNLGLVMPHQVSKTNLYIRGLSPDTTDADLEALCSSFGTVVSTKAIIDHTTNACKGYGFVDFETHQSAAQALHSLQGQSIDVHFARTGQDRDSRGPHRLDSTNLYFANLPLELDEQALVNLLKLHGRIISTRILRGTDGQSKGVGFCRMDSGGSCQQVIHHFNGKTLQGYPNHTTPLTVKFADCTKRRQTKYGYTQMSYRGLPTYEYDFSGRLPQATVYPQHVMAGNLTNMPTYAHVPASHQAGAQYYGQSPFMNLSVPQHGHLANSASQQSHSPADIAALTNQMGNFHFQSSPYVATATPAVAAQSRQYWQTSPSQSSLSHPQHQVPVSSVPPLEDHTVLATSYNSGLGGVEDY